MSIILDLIVVAIIALTVFMSARRGFIRTTIELAGFIAAIFITFTINTPLANITYDKIIEPPLLSSVSKMSDDSSVEAVNSTWESLPEFIRNNASKLGISKESIDKNISENIGNGVQNATKSVLQVTVRPVITKLFSTIYSVVLLIILMFLVKIIARFVNRLFSFSLAGKLNRILGGVIGAAKGVIIAAIFCVALTLVVSMTKNGIWAFTSETLDKSIIFKFIYNIVPFKL